MNPAPTPNKAVRITDKLPQKGLVVLCHRRWKPSHVGNDGSWSTESVLAKRNTDAPVSIDPDVSRNAWWKSEDGESSWSDSTVDSWEPAPSHAPSVPAVGGVREAIQRVLGHTAN